MNNHLLMENWRRYLNELNLEPTMGTTDTANVVYTSRALSNQQKLDYNKVQRELAKGNIPPETIAAVKKAAAQAWKDFGYNQFASLWNNTLGNILPMLPRTDQGDEQFAMDLGLATFELVGMIFGFGFLLKGAKFLATKLAPLFRALSKTPGADKLVKGSKEAAQALMRQIQTATEKVKKGGDDFIKSVQSAGENGMYKLLGAV